MTVTEAQAAATLIAAVGSAVASIIAALKSRGAEQAVKEHTATMTAALARLPAPAEKAE